jgi:hypothetical protein
MEARIKNVCAFWLFRIGHQNPKMSVQFTNFLSMTLNLESCSSVHKSRRLVSFRRNIKFHVLNLANPDTILQGKHRRINCRKMLHPSKRTSHQVSRQGVNAWLINGYENKPLLSVGRTIGQSL